jgi:hypothetical protein
MTSFIIADHLDRNEVQASTYLDKPEEDDYRKSLMNPQPYGSMIHNHCKNDRLTISFLPIVAMMLHTQPSSFWLCALSNMPSYSKKG